MILICGREFGSAATAYGGGGELGLTIVRQIVERNGGTVLIEDRPSGGTRMRVRLPLTASQQMAGGPGPAA